jgi:hypothetical protein
MASGFYPLFSFVGCRYGINGRRGSSTRPLQNVAFCPISASGSNFNPQNTQCIPSVKIFASLELEQNSTFFKGLSTMATLSISNTFTIEELGYCVNG